MILSSARDRIIAPEERRLLETHCPHAARVMEPNAGHLSVLTQPERYLAAIAAAFPKSVRDVIMRPAVARYQASWVNLWVRK